MQRFGGGLIVPIERASIIIVPISGIREATTVNLRDIVESAAVGQHVVSIDWVTQCMEDDRPVDFEPYRIRLPIAETVADVHMEEAENRPAPAIAEFIQQRSETSALYVDISPFESVAENSLPELSSARHLGLDGVPAQVEADDNDVIMPEESSVFTKGARTAASREDYPPTPPLTPHMESVAQCPTISRGLVPMRSIIPDSEFDALENDEGKIPSNSPRAQYRHDSIDADGPPRLITDPAERDQLLRKLANYSDPFQELERELLEWKEREFAGSLKSFLEGVTVKVGRSVRSRCFEKLMSKLGRSRSWESIFRKCRPQFEQVVFGLYEKGYPERRKPKELIPR